ncbi:hypothetical protein SNOG_03505 [Parastagonospora nodorum SN15]|uniref:Uncharacterized protein n=1 Tax=Phaeosphaeria nodorum (strain SN15 / ATCC MYA-4574 / FGSC 10173) TaxID=321614 RepID=Q0UXK9_PHANO|nr:hypothetical protein SNOG_03505 [Parastagonospora nodorum SN15]EAT88710.1 hypothetical protein SNOG_03505 [Parastagonospora nodorum SN15]
MPRCKWIKLCQPPVAIACQVVSDSELFPLLAILSLRTTQPMQAIETQANVNREIKVVQFTRRPDVPLVAMQPFLRGTELKTTTLLAIYGKEQALG